MAGGAEEQDIATLANQILATPMVLHVGMTIYIWNEPITTPSHRQLQFCLNPIMMSKALAAQGVSLYETCFWSLWSSSFILGYPTVPWQLGIPPT